MKVVQLVLGCGLAVGSACGGAVAFECDEDVQCRAEDRQGVCQPTGYCSFPDEGCPSGHRYGDRAPAGLGGRCVPHDATTDVLDDSSGGIASTSAASTGTAGPSTSGADTTATTAPVTTATSSTGPTATSEVEDTDDAETGRDKQLFEVSFGDRGDADVQDVTFDTFVDSSDWGAQSNFGTHADLHVWTWNSTSTSLLRFDLTTIPTSATILEATLELWTEDGVGQLQSGTISAFRMLEAWEEGDVDGNPGVANWTYRLPNVEWTTPGAKAGSHADEVLFEFSPTQHGTLYTVSIPPAVVELWTQSPGDNHGLAIYGLQGAASGDMAWVVSSEFGDEHRRPLLTILYED